jgi:hypothetical protein
LPALHLIDLVMDVLQKLKIKREKANGVVKYVNAAMIK